jgi:hypothetical protein
MESNLQVNTHHHENPLSKINSKRITKAAFLIFFVVIVSTISGFLLGYFLGISPLNKENNKTEYLESVRNDLKTEESQESFIKTNRELLSLLTIPESGPIIKICDGPWDIEYDQSIQSVECLIFYKNGSMRKELNNAHIASNSILIRKDTDELITLLEKIYYEILTVEYLESNRINALPSTGPNEVITVYSNLIPEYTQHIETKYIILSNFETYGERLKEIFEELRIYSSKVV